MSFKSKQFHILSVDDTETNRLVIEKMLTNAGYQVTSAVSGVEAIALLSGDCKPDLILLDIMMPEVNGFETCRMIKNSHKSMAKIPIIFLTAMSDIQGITNGFESAVPTTSPSLFKKRSCLHASRPIYSLNTIRIRK